MQTDIAAIKVEMAHFRERLDKIDARLADGDKNFKAQAVSAAEERGMRRIALLVGSAAITVLIAGGSWALSHGLALVEWMTQRR
jgi:hypothetical protein